ncbi:MAG: hypothetical protein HYT19_00600 [Candidatus Nealsonbacteria bacterium]|nr:hypothetical protein [Candidatus Nealsonbacteria bacterium]
MQDKKQEIKSPAPTGPMKTYDLQRSILSTPAKNELFTKYHMTGKEAEELAGSLKKYGPNLDPEDIRDLKKGLEKTIRTDPDIKKRIEATNKLNIFQKRGAIKP